VGPGNDNIATSLEIRLYTKIAQLIRIESFYTAFDIFGVHIWIYTLKQHSGTIKQTS